MKGKAASNRVFNRSNSNDERGFALIEILVAFTILALGLAAITTGVAIAMRSDGHTRASRVVIRLAQSRLEAAGISEALVPGHREGQIASNYKWQESITAVDSGVAQHEPGGVSPGQTAASTGVRSFWVEIAIQAADGTVARLAALKLCPPGKP